MIQLAKIRLKIPINVHNINYCPETIETKIPRYLQDPTQSTNVQCIKNKNIIKLNKTPYEIYTDGSKHENVTTNAFCVYKNGQLFHTSSSHLFTQNTIFQAELHAVKQAILWAIEQNIKDITIYTDCRSVRDILEQVFPSNEMVLEIHNLASLHFNKIYMVWVKAHVGVEGNELADKLANDKALELTDHYHFIKLPKSYIKRELMSTTIQKWQSEWDSSEKGRYTYKIFPKVNLIKQLLHPHIVYFLTGHGPFPNYLFKIGRRDTEDCDCGVPGDPFHFLFYCPLTRDFHFQTEPSNQNLTTWVLRAISNERQRVRLLNISKILKGKYAHFN